MKKSVVDRRPFVLLFVAYTEEGGALVSPDYEYPEVRAEYAGLVASVGLQSRWVPIAHSNLAQEIENAKQLAREQPLVVLNLCDGDDVNGYPGLSVVKALEAANLPFTGARSRFYETSTSKLRMKRFFSAADVPTAPFVRIVNPARDLARAGAMLGYPLFIKPDVSAGSAGLTPRSRVESFEDSLAVVQDLRSGELHGYDFRKAALYAEPYLSGREFTVFVHRDRRAPLGCRALPAIERVFDASVPPEQRFLTATRVSGETDETLILPPDRYAYTYDRAPDDLIEGLGELAKRAFCAVEGTGYGRVDIRYCGRTQRPYVLEVNANCALGVDENSSLGAIVTLHRIPIAEVVEALLTDALARHRRRRLEELAA